MNANEREENGTKGRHPTADLCLLASVRRRTWLCALAGFENVVDGRSEIIQACAWDDDGVATPVRFFGDAQEPATLVLAEFKMKPLSFDLNFFRFENAVHFETSGGV